MKRLLFLLPSASLLVSATPGAHPPGKMDAEHYLDQYVDKSVDPRQDFFKYSVGKWLKANPIPANERSWGIAHVVQEETYHRLVSISEVAAKSASAPRGSNAQKIGDFWYAAMDSETIDRQGFAPLKAEFARIDAVHDMPGLLTTVARIDYLGAGAMCSLAIFQDEMASDRDALHLYQGGLGLPNRDFYFDDSDRMKMLRKEYVAHVAKMFVLLGDDAATADTHAATVMTIETELAGASRKLEDLRDPHANYNAMTVDSVTLKLTPTIRWRTFLADGGIRNLNRVVVGQPEFFQQLEKSLHTHGIEEWKTYLRWQLVNAYADEAGGKFHAEHFHYYGTIMNGTSEERPRWKRMLDEEEGFLGDALGRLYVQRYFSPSTKARYEKLTDEIFAAYRERIHDLDWMSEATKVRALKKLNAVTKKVGYPAKWKDYSKFDVDRTSFLGNCVRGNIWRSDYVIAKLFKPVDRTEWDMTPQTYNAYYNPSNNEIVLPAAIFILPGIADSLVDDAVVYSYAGGTTIGHEITHGFDDEGRQFDEKGNLKEWWTPKDAEEFTRRASRIINQFNGYVAVDTMHVNGSATQGENIADLGGALLSWDAFKKTAEYKSGKSIGGYTPTERFLIGWSLGWMNALRPENLALRVKTDVHSPSPLRVNGPMANLPAYYEAYSPRPGDAMFRADSVRVRIWSTRQPESPGIRASRFLAMNEGPGSGNSGTSGDRELKNLAPDLFPSRRPGVDTPDAGPNAIRRGYRGSRAIRVPSRLEARATMLPGDRVRRLEPGNIRPVAVTGDSHGHR